jgi:hypothetical protein
MVNTMSNDKDVSNLDHSNDMDDLPDKFLDDRTPAQIATEIGLRQALADEILGALIEQEPLCLVIATPGPGWCRPVADAVNRMLLGSCNPDNGFAVHFVLREKTERYSSDESDKIARWLSRGRAVIGVSPLPETMLPPILLRSADHKLLMPPISGATIRTVITEIAGEDPGELSDDIGGPIDLADLTAAVRWGSRAASCVRRLERAGAARSRSRSVDAPPLETMVGYGAARVWGLGLVREVARFRRGEISLSALPRGMLISGSPGVGKTLLAQSIAQSAKLPLIATSAAKWMAAGHLGDCITLMNADFADARRLAPAIIFIDEIDALVDPSKDGSNGRSWFLSFRAAVLANIDGAATEPGIILLGACNHPDLVDAALRRSGRLDRHFEIPLPDAQALEEIIRLHLAADLPWADLSGLAQIAIGSTGADIARALREARSRARDAERPITFEDLVASLAPPDLRSETLRRRIAIHEAGHAVVAWRVGLKIEHVSLIACAGTGGHVNVGQPSVLSHRELEQAVMMRLGGRAADTVVGTGPCAGSSSDLAAATATLVAAENQFGLGSSLIASAADAPIAQILSIDPTLRRLVGRKLDELWTRALSIVRKNEGAVRQLAGALLARKVLTGNEVEHILAASPGITIKQDGLPPPLDPTADRSGTREPL